MDNLKEIKENLKLLMQGIDKNINSLYRLATHDPKTGLHNYQFFSEFFDIELEKAKRGNNLCLAIFDIDHFKAINTKYGHIQADKILYKIAQLLKKSLRKYDLIARFGGEEFIMLSPNTTLSKAKKVGERLRKKVESYFLKKHITISGGIADYKNKDNKQSLKERADSALYKAKNKGRNRIEIC